VKGELFGAIPYDFDRPTLRKLRDTVWNPGNARILVPHAFGVGWTVNLAALKRRFPAAFWTLVALAGWRVLRIVRSFVRR
jgi:hypothetical protein